MVLNFQSITEIVLVILGWGYLGAHGPYLDKLRRRPLVDPTYQILRVSEKIYPKLFFFLFHYIQQNLENTKFDFLKYSHIRNKSKVRWNKK